MKSKYFIVKIEKIQDNEIIVRARNSREAKAEVEEVIKNSNFLESEVMNKNKPTISISIKKVKVKCANK